MRTRPLTVAALALGAAGLVSVAACHVGPAATSTTESATDEDEVAAAAAAAALAPSVTGSAALELPSGLEALAGHLGPAADAFTAKATTALAMASRPDVTAVTDGQRPADAAVAAAAAASTAALFAHGGRGAYEVQGEHNANVFWFELDRDLAYLAIGTGHDEARQFFGQKPEGRAAIDRFVQIARATLRIQTTRFDEGGCFRAAERVGIDLYDISDDDTKATPTATVAYLGDSATGEIYATGGLDGCHRLDPESFQAFMAAARELGAK